MQGPGNGALLYARSLTPLRASVSVSSLIHHQSCSATGIVAERRAYALTPLLRALSREKRARAQCQNLSLVSKQDCERAG